jgi:D-lactate dehydrogenase
MPDNFSSFISKLNIIVGEKNVLTDPTECEAFGHDYSRTHIPPDAVAFVENSNQIQAVVQLCNQTKTPLTVRGFGTNMVGACVPLKKGLVLSCERMNRILKIDSENRFMIVEPGVFNLTVQEEAAKHGFFWAPDPGSAAICSVGGNIACNAAGPRGVKYGAVRENILGLKAITGAGEKIKTGTFTTKSAVGYDFTRLLIGSEGTLAIITEATLKLIPLPETKKTIRAIYNDIHAAAGAVTKIMSQGAIPCALEFMDQNAIHLLRTQGVSFSNDAKAVLMIEVDGFKNEIDFMAEKIIHAATQEGLIEIIAAENSEEAKQLWDARKKLSPLLKTIAPIKINEDVAVPVSQLPQLMLGLEKLSQKYEILIVNFGHAGNGNIHVNLMIDTPQLEKARQCLNEVFNLVLLLDGSLSGEHGIGLEKKDFIDREVDPVSLSLMRGIKKLFDPNGILNPGKIFV